MFDFSGFEPLFAWNPVGHYLITGWAVTAAVMALRSSGKIARLLMSPEVLQDQMGTLPLMDCKEDLTTANMIGLSQEALEWAADTSNEAGNWVLDHTIKTVHLEVPSAVGFVCGAELTSGGQIAHFMRDHAQSPREAYWMSFGHIREHCLAAWESLNIAIPFRTSGWLGQVEAYVDTRPSVQAIRNTAFQYAMHRLGAGLHTLQDSFSPSHTLRDATGMFIENVFNWSLDNRHANAAIDWPGHGTNDNWHYSDITQTRTANAGQASRDLILTVFENVHEPEGVFRHVLDLTMKRVMHESPALPTDVTSLKDTW